WRCNSGRSAWRWWLSQRLHVRSIWRGWMRQDPTVDAHRDDGGVPGGDGVVLRVRTPPSHTTVSTGRHVRRLSRGQHWRRRPPLPHLDHTSPFGRSCAPRPRKRRWSSGTPSLLLSCDPPTVRLHRCCMCTSLWS
ncbi:Hypothetical protein, putative, partial [Bodo saltans]